eukprot:jgi/Mesen1/5993/ME000304S05006
MCLCGACFSACGGCLCMTCSAGVNRGAAKYVYAFFFLVAAILAWVIRDYSHPVLKGCQGGNDCLGAEGVLRISMGMFAFYAIMFATTVGTKVKESWRDTWHNGWWLLKAIMLVLLLFPPFFMPSVVFQVYGELARIGSGLFLLVQLVSVLNFVYVWSDAWLADLHNMYVFFAPRASCGLNILFITLTLALVVLFTALSLHVQVSANLFTSGVMSAYCVFLCYSAIMSEPPSSTCNTRSRQTGHGDWVTVISFLLAFFTIIFSTCSTGVDSHCFSLKERAGPADGEVPYGYGFFHFVFAMGCMYMAMLFLGWNLHQTQTK